MKYTNYYKSSTFNQIAKECNNIWLFSDPHFNDPESKLMNANWPDADEIIKKINSKVGKKDCIVFLGDIGDIEYVKKIKGYKVLIMGNHDKGASNYLRYKYEEPVDLYSKKEDMSENFDHFRYAVESELIAELENGDKSYSTKSVKYAVYDNKLFDEVYEGPLFINEKILLSHEPIELKFGVNIHGHCHGGYRKLEDENCSRYNVCSDVIDFTPVRIDDILNEVKGKSIHRITIDRATDKK